MSASALEIFLSGAPVDGGVNLDQRLSLGGFRSVARGRSLGFRRVNALRGLRIEEVSGLNGPGNGSLVAMTADSLAWMAPGSGLRGAAVTLAAGETVTLEDGEAAGRWVRVARTGEDDLLGTETVICLEIFNDIFGGSNFSAAEAVLGAAKYRKLFLRNAGETDITGLRFWLDDAMAATVRLAKETPDGENAIALLEDESTEPPGASWNTGEDYAGGLDIGTLAAGALHGLVIETGVAAMAAAAPWVDVLIHFQFTFAAVEYAGQLRGLHRIQGLAQVELYVELVTPIPGTHSPKAISTDVVYTPAAGTWELNAPVSWAGPFTPGATYFGALYGRNSWGVLSPLRENYVLRIDDEGNEGHVPPAAPSEVSIVATAAGGFLVFGLYHRFRESAPAYEADGVALWYTVDGVAPDTSGAPDETVAFTTPQAREFFEFVGAGVIDQAPVEAIVKTYRLEGEEDEITVYSENTETVSTVAEWLGPALARGQALQGQTAALWVPPMVAPDGTPIFVDGDENGFYWELRAGDTRLYAPGGGLVFRVLYNSHDLDASGIWIVNTLDPTVYVVSGAAAAGVEENADAYTKFYLSVNGGRLWVVDLTAGEIRAGEIDLTYQDLPGVNPQTPVWPRFADTLLQVWDPATENYVSWSRISADGSWQMRIDLTTLDETSILALEAI